MTVHAAKGLEFSAVFLPRMHSTHFPVGRKANMALLAEGLGPGVDEHDQEGAGVPVLRGSLACP